MIRLDDIEIFVHAAEQGSFSEAARQLNIAPGHASVSVQRLERALDTRLFVRSTRSMQLSDAGERYLPFAKNMLNAQRQGHSALSSGQTALSGTLRISAPSDFGRNLMLPWLDQFLVRHPGLSLHVKTSDRAVDLMRQPLDVAIRYGALPDSSLVAMSLLDSNRRALCAAPGYLVRRGAPEKVEDLRRHNCLRFVWGEQIHERWRFTLPGGERVVAVTGNRVSDDADAVRRWAIAGEGVIYKSRLDLIPDLNAGRLVEIFPQDHCEPSPLHLVCADRAKLTPAVIQLHAFLRQQCTALNSTASVAIPPFNSGSSGKASGERRDA